MMLLLWGSILLGQQTICIGSIKNYWVDIAENSGNGTSNSKYSWTVVEPNFKGVISAITSSGNKITINWKNTPAGNYTLLVTESNNGCSSSQQLNIKLISIESELEPNYFICPDGGPIKIDAGNNPLYTYNWTVPAGVPNPGNVSYVFTNVPGNYSVSVFNGVCSQNFTTTLSISGVPVINEIKETKDGVIEVFAVGGTLPLSFSLDGINWQTSNVFSNLISGKTYTVFVKSNAGCVISKSITIFFMPNVITPYVDGYNDRLDIKGIENFPNAQLQVYDRFGELVFDSAREKTFRWNGYYNGRPLPTASYWYVLDLGNGQEKKTGYILIKNRN